MKIVVARYKEDVAWTKQFQNVLIFNKGEPLKDTEYSESFLPNVGREGHTFFKYIYDNYDNLDDYTIFLQGHPYDHCPDLNNIINNIANDTSYNTDFDFLASRILNCTMDRCPHHCGQLPLRETYKKIYGDNKEEPAQITFGAGGQFIASKKLIHSRPKEHYYNIYKTLDYHLMPIEGYVIERFTKLLFFT